MSAKPKLMNFVGTRDAAKARAFYGETLGPKLGLKLEDENPYALVFDCGGTMLRVQSVHELTPHQFTVLGWEVADIRQSIKELKAAGVAFARYPGLPQDDDGVWTTPDGSFVAWFSDPDGNILSLTQFAE